MSTLVLNSVTLLLSTIFYVALQLCEVTKGEDTEFLCETVF